MVKVGFTRREIVASLLGAPALFSCRDAPVTWDGELLGASAAAGHRLRAPQAITPEETEEIPILILGGGVSGLSAGWWLRRSGQERFRLLELEPELGGTARSGQRRGLEFPWGAHYLAAPRADQPDLLQLLEETKTIVGRDDAGQPLYDEAQICAAPKERIFLHGFWSEGLYPSDGASAEDLAELDRFRRTIDAFVGLRGEDGRRAFRVPVEGSSRDPKLLALDRISMSEWLAREGYRSARLRWFIEYGCRDDFGTELGHTSAWAGLHYFASRTEVPGEESADFLTWPEGNAFLVRALGDRVGRERISAGTLVVGIAPHGDGRRAEVTSVDLASGRAKRWIASRVIFALPSFLRRFLVRGFERLPEYHPSYSPWLVANLHLRGRPGSRGFPTAWDNVIYQSRSLGYVVATHQRHLERGSTVWTYYLPLTGADDRAERRKLEALSWSDAAPSIVGELARCHLGLEAELERVDLFRWGHAMVRPVPGALFGAERARAAESQGPLIFAHTDLSGIALFEEAFSHGVRAAREALAALERGA